MKVRCKYNSLDSVKNKDSVEVFKKDISEGYIDYDLTIGREYTVYGLVFWDSLPRYYLSSDIEENYPVPYPCIYFEMAEPRMSRHWRMSISDKVEPLLTEFVFPEWADDKLFYEKLLDDDPECIEIYKKYKELMDKEFE